MENHQVNLKGPVGHLFFNQDQDQASQVPLVKDILLEGQRDHNTLQLLVEYQVNQVMQELLCLVPQDSQLYPDNRVQKRDTPHKVHFPEHQVHIHLDQPVLMNHQNQDNQDFQEPDHLAHQPQVNQDSLGFQDLKDPVLLAHQPKDNQDSLGFQELKAPVLLDHQSQDNQDSLGFQELKAPVLLDHQSQDNQDSLGFQELKAPVLLAHQPQGNQDSLGFQELKAPVLLDHQFQEVLAFLTMVVIQAEIILQSLENQEQIIPYILRFRRHHFHASNSSFQGIMLMSKRNVKYSTFVLTTKRTISSVQMAQYFIRNTSYVFGGINSTAVLLLGYFILTKNYMIIQ